MRSTIGRTTTLPRDLQWKAVDVADGDTFTADGPEGRWTVRIIGINAPDPGECYSDKARAKLEDLVLGRNLRLVRDTTDIDEFGRHLRYVETQYGADVGGILVANGFALSYRLPPDTARSGTYAGAQETARTAEFGLWAKDACGSNNGSNIKISVHADAEGADQKNLNDEWVKFTNTGTTPVNFNNFVVSDESSRHKYTIYELILDPGATLTLYSGCGNNDSITRYWCSEKSAIWDNDGDTVYLRDGNGNNIAVLTYEGT